MQTVKSLSKFPTYAKLAQVIIGLIAVFFILYIGHSIIVPLMFAILIGILLNPIVNFMVCRKVPRVLAIGATLLLAMVIIGLMVYLISSQIMHFTETFPQFKVKFNWLFDQLTVWGSDHLNIPKSRIESWMTEKRGDIMKASTPMIGHTLGTIGILFAYFFLLPVYVFMILFYKPLLLEFIARLFPKHNHDMVAEVLVETKSVITSYLMGLLIETAIIAFLNCLALLVIGVQYAVLIGILGALLNLIPYIGGLIALAIPVLIAFATMSPVSALYVVITYVAIQFIDNNIIVPRVVASKVQLNALVSIVVVLMWGSLWGIPGMFLAIPLTAIVKVIFDRVPNLQAFGFLLGDNQPSIGKVIFDFNTYKYSRSKKKVVTT